MLAATLGASYGIYGPPFEHSRRQPLRSQDRRSTSTRRSTRSGTGTSTRPGTSATLITRINQIRRENPALHSDRNLRFIPTDNDQMIAYGKATPDLSNLILVVVNLDPYHTQSGWVRVPFWASGSTMRARLSRSTT